MNNPATNRSSDHYKKMIEGCESDVVRSWTDLQITTREIDALQKDLKTRETTTECKTCGQSLSDEIKDRMFGKLEGDLPAMLMKKEALEKEHSIHQTAKKSCQDEYEKAILYEKQQEDQKQREKTEKQITNLEAQVAELTTETARLQDTLSEARTASSDALEAQRAFVDTKQQVDAQRTSYAIWERDAASAKEAVKTAKEATSPYTAILGGEVAKLGSLQAKRTKFESFLTFFKKELSYVEFWVQGFSNAGVKSLLMEMTIPFLNEKVNEYFTILCDGQAHIEFSAQITLASGDVRDKFNVDVSYDYGCNSIRGVSGGELQRADIPIQLALGALASSRVLAPVNLRCLDEPFGALDSSGKEKMVKLLREVITPEVGTLLVVTHDEELKLLFDKVIRVEKHGGISEIVA